MLFQYAEVAAFCDPIERLTGRTVRSFISRIDTEADLASEMFVLHPAGYEGPSRSSLHTAAEASPPLPLA